jgi:hypothetical protein
MLFSTVSYVRPVKPADAVPARIKDPIPAVKPKIVRLFIRTFLLLTYSLLVTYETNERI